MTTRVRINNTIAEVYRGETWRKDRVYIHNLRLNEKEVAHIIEYLYNEGFIEDRRTVCELIGLEN